MDAKYEMTDAELTAIPDPWDDAIVAMADGALRDPARMAELVANVEAEILRQKGMQ